MSLAVSLLTQALLVLSITGSPFEVRNSPITVIPLTSRLNFSNGAINLLQHDKARVAAFGNYNTYGRPADIIPLLCYYYGYTIAVGTGSPPTTYNLIVDTGSSVTWVKNDVYVQTDTSVNTNRRVKQEYGHARDDDDDDSDDSDDGDNGDDSDDDSGDGIIWNDTVTLGGLNVTGFPIGDIGILGIGPKSLSLESLTDEPDDMIPTITDYLYDQGKIDEYVFGVFFQPITTEPDSLSGEVTFGGTDNTKYIGDVVYTPVTRESPASDFWGISQRITYGTTEILDTSAGIVDTGTVLLNLPSDAFEKYVTATGATRDEGNGLLSLTMDKYNALQDLDFHIEGKIFSLTANAQIWPRSLNDKVGGEPDGIYLIVTNSGAHSGQGNDFNLGQTFLRRFYTVFDRTNSRVGFAKTPFTDATTN
ncbi:aspartic peptidase domain-containing protein [Suillus spraguei]|nr:aspartic peptidase domain-containing protein [Suillus spraguei]